MPDARLDLILSLHRAGRLDEAESGYRDCLGAGLAEAGFPLAVLLLQRQRYAEASELLETQAAQAPDNADVAANLSLALRHVGRFDDALHAARRACALAPERVAAWNALGLAALAAERLEEALAAFDAGLRIQPQHPALGLHRAEALHRLRRDEEAAAAYESLLRSHPDLSRGWRGLADAQVALGQAEAALRSRERALQLLPQDHETALEYAVSLLHVGRAAEAVRRLERLTQAASDDAQLWSWLGRARLQTEEPAAAGAAFERAFSLDADDPVIRHFHAATSGTLPDVVESDYIRRLFDDFADRFERTLVGKLGYAIPSSLIAFLRARDADVGRTVLDLGCGTGLMAEQLARVDRCIDGVDLSERMLEQARAKGLYRALHAAELAAFLQGATGHWELIVAADVFIYVASLRPIFSHVFERLAPGGRFAFSIERSAGESTELVPASGRYRHAPAQVVAQLTAAGFVDVVGEDAVLRLESGRPVAGELLLARRPD